MREHYVTQQQEAKPPQESTQRSTPRTQRRHFPTAPNYSIPQAMRLLQARYPSKKQGHGSCNSWHQTRDALGWKWLVFVHSTASVQEIWPMLETSYWRRQSYTTRTRAGYRLKEVKKWVMEKAHLNQTQKESETRENQYHADKEELANIQIRA